MESLEMHGKTVEEAIALALEQLSLEREEVEVTVIREGKSGIMGIGSEGAIVKVTPIKQMEVSDDAAKIAQKATQEVLQYMSIPASVEIAPPLPGEMPGIILNIVGDDMGILIGRRGQTLVALQQIVRLITSHYLKTWVPLSIDVEGYRRRRYTSLKTLARHLAEQVRETGKSITLEPMPSNERRIIHIALADYPDLTTESVGEGEGRKVVISLKNKD